MAAASVLAAVVAAGTLTSCAPTGLGSSELFLQGLEERCEEVASALSNESIDAQCDHRARVVINNEGTEYILNDFGVSHIEKEVVFISHIVVARDGHVQGIIVSVGGGIDAAKAKYSMRDLSKPKVFYWGDDIEWVQSSIEKEISTDEMKELVAQAEHYQDVIRAELDKLESE